ncbi:ABC transporter permease [Collinsella tanakaei]|uniref:Cell division protein FtsX n=1 Tax=Collinsella ihumii TaxID=1720204 RepID=A0AAW7K3I1_9ACTN|nr:MULTISPECIES: permease-like cell division protein FtsX [Collinsella]MBM6776226.1 ABC transporter permease [Collinsella tanakaei]MBM6786646.1 ABC transporter permease [Collinsella tanakaei]MBM6906641.1 ABC transporter permease [Collinsella tanakaei]MDN0064165.1 permease-like cell division protein FtsX [Collinsella ihumii]MDN0069757.1 permease-like cell division protein FtsX [Collinsella ihumii]
MAPSNFGYSLREAGSHFARNLGTSIGAVITIFLSLFIIGLFILGSAVVNSMIGSVEDQVKINAFISDDATDEQIQAFYDKLTSWENVKSVQFKTKEDALADYTSNISNNADMTLGALDGENPLPRSFVIEMYEPSQVEETAERIKADTDFRQIVDDDNPDVDDVEADVNAGVLYGQEEVSVLFQMTAYIRVAVVVLVGLLTFISFIFINNTIRLSITARRREIAIMRLVGASNSFIRGPFLTEGVLQALLGSLLTIGALELCRNFGMPMIQSVVSFLTINIPLRMYLFTYAALVLIGIVIGLFGSAIAMRRYLKV